MADSVIDWLYRDRLPRDLYEFVGRKRLDPDLEGLRTDLESARSALTEYQDHWHPLIARQSKQLLQEVDRWVDARGRLRPLDDLLNEIVEQLRSEYGRRQGDHRSGWDRDRLIRWLEREGRVHPDSSARTADALLDETAPEMPKPPVAAPVTTGFRERILQLGGCVADWAGARFYWRHRRELLQAINDQLDDTVRSEKPRTLWFGPEDDDPRASFEDGKWTVQLLGRCVVCGARSTAPARTEELEVVDCARPLMAPLAGLGVGTLLALFFWTKWLLPLGLLCSFVVGARCAPAATVSLQYQTCPVHERKRRTPKVRLLAGRLAIDGVPRTILLRLDAYDDYAHSRSY